MGGPDLSTPRGLGAFVLALKPSAFLDEKTFDAGMTHYLESLRQSPARTDAGAETHVMAPGDREWRVAEEREREGIPLDPATQEAFRRFVVTYGIALPFADQE
jgi:LDH2 family malate/lactate/ureidoglycolate dehydrogenase